MLLTVMVVAASEPAAIITEPAYDLLVAAVTWVLMVPLTVTVPGVERVTAPPDPLVPVLCVSIPLKDIAPVPSDTATTSPPTLPDAFMLLAALMVPAVKLLVPAKNKTLPALAPAL